MGRAKRQAPFEEVNTLISLKYLKLPLVTDYPPECTHIFGVKDGCNWSLGCLLESRKKRARIKDRGLLGSCSLELSVTTQETPGVKCAGAKKGGPRDRSPPELCHNPSSGKNIYFRIVGNG